MLCMTGSPNKTVCSMELSTLSGNIVLISPSSSFSHRSTTSSPLGMYNGGGTFHNGFSKAPIHARTRLCTYSSCARATGSPSLTNDMNRDLSFTDSGIGAVVVGGPPNVMQFMSTSLWSKPVAKLVSQAFIRTKITHFAGSLTTVKCASASERREFAQLQHHWSAR
jgi:hypothetical protein